MSFAIVIVHEVVGVTSFDLRSAPDQQLRLHDACVRESAACIGLDISGMVALSRTYFGALIWPVVEGLVAAGRFGLVLNVPEPVVGQLVDGVLASRGVLWRAGYRRGALHDAVLIGEPPELGEVLQAAVRRGGGFTSGEVGELAPAVPPTSLARRLATLAEQGVLRREPARRPIRYAVPWAGHVPYLHDGGLVGRSRHSGDIPEGT